AQRLLQLSQRLAAFSPQQRLARLRTDLAARGKLLQLLLGQRFAAARSRLQNSEGLLASYSPQATLERGYAIAQKADGRIVRDAAALALGEELRLRFARGKAGARVTGKDPP